MKKRKARQVEYFPIGSVVATDGDTIACDYLASSDSTLYGAGLYFKHKRIRLARIQAAELKSGPEGERLRKVLEKLIFSGLNDTGIAHENIRIVVTGQGADKYGRVGAEVFINDVNASDHMMANGARKYGVRDE